MLRRLWNQDAFQGNFLELGVHVQHLGIGGNSGKHLHKVPRSCRLASWSTARSLGRKASKIGSNLDTASSASLTFDLASKQVSSIKRTAVIARLPLSASICSASDCNAEIANNCNSWTAPHRRLSW